MYGLIAMRITSINSSSRGVSTQCTLHIAVKIADLSDMDRCLEMPEMVVNLFKET